MSLARNLLTVITGRLASQVLLLASVPILTRLYLPEHFGVIALLMGIAQVARALSTLRYDQALPQCRDAEEAGALLGLCVVIAGATSLFMVVAALIAAGPMARAYGAPELVPFVALLPLVVAAQTFNALGNQWAAFRQRFGPVAATAVLATFVRRGLPIPYGLALTPSSLGLFLGFALAPVGCVLTYARMFGRDVVRHVSFARDRLRGVAYAFRSFPLHMSGVAMLDLLSEAAPAFVLGLYWSLTEVGLYGQARALLGLPLGLFIEAAARTFYPRLAQEDHAGGDATGLVRRMLAVLIDLGIYPLGAVLVAGPDLFALVLGEGFRESGHLARLMVPWFLPWLVFSPLSVAINVRGQQPALLRQTVTLTVIRFGVLVGFAMFGTLRQTVLAYALVNGIFMAGQLAWVLRFMGVSVAGAARLFGARAVGGALALAPAGALRFAGGGVLLQLGALAGGAVGYALWVARVNPEARRLVAGALGRFRAAR